MPRLSCQIEAILYLKAQAISIGEITEITGCDRDVVEEGLLELMADFAHRETALEIAETPAGYALQLKNDYQSLLQKIVPADIGIGALRTLAVIALKDPIIQTELIELRGSTAYSQVQELVEQGFVRKRRKADARSSWLQVTDKFHQYFQLSQLASKLDQFSGKASKARTEELPADSTPDTPITIADESLAPLSEVASIDTTNSSPEEPLSPLSDELLDEENERFERQAVSSAETHVLTESVLTESF